LIVEAGRSREGGGERAGRHLSRPASAAGL